MGQVIESRFHDTAKHIARIQGRGGKVVFLRLPVTGPLVEREEKLAPRAATWDRLVRENKVPAIHFAEHLELRSFECPEWSHLSAADSVEFTRRLVPHLKAALNGKSVQPVYAATTVPNSASAP